jgi:uncharacterized protein YkwD
VPDPPPAPVAQKGNDSMLRRSILLATLVLALGFNGLTAAAPAPSAGVQTSLNADASGYCMDTEEQAFLQLINNYRALNGLGPLVAVQTLGASSDYHSADMATDNYFSHTLNDGTTWSQNIRNYGYSYNTYLGENIAAGNKYAADTFTQWKNSSGHNANMLNGNYKAIGIGRAYGATATYRWYWTTDFGGVVDAAAVLCSGSPTPTPTNSPPPTATNAPQLTPTKTSTPQPTASNTPQPTPTKTPTSQPSATNTPQPTPQPSATNTPQPALSVYVAALTGKGTKRSSTTSLSIQVTVGDTRGLAVRGATVTGALVAPDGSTQTLAGTTNNRGQVSWSVRSTAGAGSYVASVSGVSAGGMTYDPNLNRANSITISIS